MVVVVVVVIYAVAPFKTKTGDCREENRGLSGDKSMCEEFKMKFVYGVEDWKSFIVNLLRGTKKCYTRENTQGVYRNVTQEKVILICKAKSPWSS